MKRSIIAILLALAPSYAFAAQAVLTWTNAVDNRITATQIERKDAACTAGGTFVSTGSVASGVATFTDTTVAEGATYCYRARHAAGATSFSDYSNTAQITIAVTPINPPSNLTVQ